MGPGQGAKVTAPMAPSCPQCGSGMHRKEGAAGPFYGCSAYPACRGSLDVDAPAGEHPITRTRRLAMRVLDRRGRCWSDDDRADALGDALVTAMEHGWAHRREAWRFVAERALRWLRGWHRSRTCSVSEAGPAMLLDDEHVSPTTWLEAQGAPAEQEIALQASQVGPMSTVGDALLQLRAGGWTEAEIRLVVGPPPEAGGWRRASLRQAVQLLDLASEGADPLDVPSRCTRRERWRPSAVSVVRALFCPGLLAIARRSTEAAVSERTHLAALLAQAKTVVGVAALLGVDRSTASRRLAAAGLEYPSQRRSKKALDGRRCPVGP